MATNDSPIDLDLPNPFEALNADLNLVKHRFRMILVAS